MKHPSTLPQSTKDQSYAQGLIQAQSHPLRDWIVQFPYRMHLKYGIKPGVTLDIGCGAGRNLKNLPRGSVGIDHNIHAVKYCQTQGLQAREAMSFLEKVKDYQNHFDSILLSHVLEHLSAKEADQLLSSLIQVLKPQGRLIIICPQERGYQSDATHVRFCDFKVIEGVLDRLGMKLVRHYSFPFPRLFGRFFTHNEFVGVGQRVLS